MSYIEKNLKPVPLDSLVDEHGELEKWRDTVAIPAAMGLIEVHRASGIDLKHWKPVLNFVQSVYPSFSIEGEPEW